MKNILVLTDFSAPANAASEYAIQMAKNTKSNLKFLHLFSTPIDWLNLSKEKEAAYPEVQHAIAKAKSNLLDWVKKANEHGVDAKKALDYNVEMDEIWSQINNHHHDFIIMGSSGKKDLKHKLLGSKTSAIIHQAPVPVLVLQEPILQPIKNILFVSNFTDVPEERVQTLTQFANSIDAPIDLLFVNTPKHFEDTKTVNQRMKLFRERCKPENDCTMNVINASSVEKGIIDFLETKPMSLIAVFLKKQKGIRQLFSSDLAGKIITNTSLPTLSILD